MVCVPWLSLSQAPFVRSHPPSTARSALLGEPFGVPRRRSWRTGCLLCSPAFLTRAVRICTCQCSWASWPCTCVSVLPVPSRHPGRQLTCGRCAGRGMHPRVLALASAPQPWTHRPHALYGLLARPPALPGAARPLRVPSDSLRPGCAHCTPPLRVCPPPCAAWARWAGSPARRGWRACRSGPAPRLLELSLPLALQVGVLG